MVARKLVIIGDSAFAQIAYHYFNEDTDYEVVGFAVEREFLKATTCMALPVVPFEKLSAIFPPAEHSVFAAITYAQLNRLRARLVDSAKNMGYSLASYISPHAYVSKHAKLGEHCFVFENNVIQPYCEISNDVIFWSGNHIGHHSKIGAHCFVSSHVVISGFVATGENCFFGVNSTVANNITLGDDCWIGPAVVVSKDVSSGTLFPPAQYEPSRASTHKFFKLKVPGGTEYART